MLEQANISSLKENYENQIQQLSHCIADKNKNINSLN